jgi:hypothetical protein
MWDAEEKALEFIRRMDAGEFDCTMMNEVRLLPREELFLVGEFS